MTGRSSAIGRFFTITVIVLLLFFCACEGDKAKPVPLPAPSTETTPATPSAGPEITPQAGESAPENPDAASGVLTITFDYEHQPGSASNQFAVWVENSEGKLIRTLFASRWTAQGGYKTRPDSIALWVEKSNLASMTKPEVDAVSSATPITGTLEYSWDFTDTGSERVPAGQYTVYVEGTLRWKNRVLYSCDIATGDGPFTVLADAEFTYAASDRQPALNAGSPENSMIGEVTVSFALK